MRRPLLAAAVLILGAAPARAHYKLVAPASASQQDALGDPQKSGPCGPTDPDAASVATGAVTEVLTGSMLTVTVDETIFHPGHYRVALAQTRAGLPADPVVTPGGGDACRTAAIDPSPALPVLGDGLLAHSARFSGPQSVQVQLPAGMTCDNCVLQVLEFMSNHGAPCFYYHCATITITDNPRPPMPDAGPGGEPGDADGGCSAGGGAGGATLALGLLAWRRRRVARAPGRAPSGS